MLVHDSFHANKGPLTCLNLSPSVNPDQIPLPTREAQSATPLQRENNLTNIMKEINQIN